MICTLTLFKIFAVLATSTSMSVSIFGVGRSFSGTGEKSYRMRPVSVVMVMLVLTTIGTLTWLGTFSPWSPVMDAWSSAPVPVAYLKGRSPLELRALVDDDIVPRLQQAQGVGAITVNGGQVRQINVQMDLNKLKSWRILRKLPGKKALLYEICSATQAEAGISERRRQHAAYE